MDKQNVTLSLPRSILRKAKMIAMEQDRSLSALMVELLTELVEREDQYARAKAKISGSFGPGYRSGYQRLNRLDACGLSRSLKFPIGAYMTRQFVDTNVLVYAHDRSAGQKRVEAQNLLRDLWQSGLGCLSIQVLQEYYVYGYAQSRQSAVSGTGPGYTISSW